MKVRLRLSFMLSSREEFADQLHLGKRPRQQSLFFNQSETSIHR